MGEFVTLEVLGGIGTIRLDRPPTNVLNFAAQGQLRAAAVAAAADSSIRAVVVYGGEQVFAAGADIRQMAAMSHVDMAERAAAISVAFDEVAKIPKPVVAAVAGYALGLGCELALACDFRVTSADAQFGQPEIELGIIPGAGGTQRLPRLVGPARAKRIIMSGDLLDAEQALAIGLVDQIAPSGQSVYDAAVAMIQPYLSGPARALRAAKLAIDNGLSTDLRLGLAVESQLLAELFATEDRTEGMSAFLDQRRPSFTGQ